MRKVFPEQLVAGLDGVTTSIAVASTATIWTRAFKLSFGDHFGISYIATATGSPSLKIELEQSFQEPTTEGATDANWVEGENISDIESDLTTETMHHKEIVPVTLPYGRIKITGSATNPASTTIKIWIHQQQEL